MLYFKIVILAILQGACELLPVSSSAHVIVAEKLMGIDPATPEMTLLLVMLHTGTMLAVIFYFKRSWQVSFFGSRKESLDLLKFLLVATFVTGIVGLGLKVLIEKVFLAHVAHAEVEMIFGNLGIVSPALAAAGILIVYSGIKTSGARRILFEEDAQLAIFSSVVIGAVQGLCLPFRGFSRSGATISTGLLLDVSRRKAEEFSFALAVVLTPPVVLKEIHRLLEARSALGPQGAQDLAGLFLPSLIGMAASFLAGLVALKWLSSWLESGRWQYFGYYCLAASAFVFLLHMKGF